MKNIKQDSTSAVARFGRDKRNRVETAERVERRPRPQRDADSEGHSFGAGRNNSSPKRDFQGANSRRSSYNPNFTADNRPIEGERAERGGARSAKGGYGKSGGYGGSRGGNQGGFNRGGQGGFKGGNRSEGRGGYGAHNSENFSERNERKGSYGEGRGSYGEGKFGGQNRGAARSEGYRGGSAAGKGGSRFKERGEGRGFKPNRSGEERQYSYPKYNPAKQVGEMRLNRFLAQSGLCSRREADDFIQAGLVTVNGVIVTELGSKVMPSDEVRFNDERVQGEKKVYLVLNKPKGYVTSLEDPHADKTVMKLVKGACSERIYPVGRLDKNSLGLLLFTNDGDVTRQLTHPSLEKKKIYQVTLDKPLTRADMEQMTEGLTLEDGEIYADEVAYVSENKKEVGVEIHSGRNRIVRRIFEHLGYSVQKLDRVYYAGITKKNLKRGQWRFLTNAEVERLKSGRYE